MHRSVYLPGHEALAPLAREWAALLACGSSAVISHLAAGRSWQLIDACDSDAIDVTVVGRKVRSRVGIRVHRTSDLPPTDIRLLDGLPVTSPARTILDLAAIGFDDLERAVSEAHARKLIGRAKLQELLERARGRRGVGALRAIVEAEKSGFTRSKAERLLRRLIRDAGLPQPLSNTRVAGFEVDILWPEHKLIVEFDSWGFHGHRAAFERDRRKGAALVAAGYRVIRITWRQLNDGPLAVAAMLGAALTGVGSRG